MNKIIEANKKLNIKDIEEFEEKYNIVLPVQYRNFLLKYNGGYPEFFCFKISKEQGENIVNMFYCIGDEDDSLEQSWEYLEDILPEGFIPIADDPSGNQICLGILGQYIGKIYFFIHDVCNDKKMNNMIFLANGFDSFFNNLY